MAALRLSGFAATLPLAALLLATAAPAAEPMSEKRALAAAVAILKGDPYGTTDAAVVANIHERRIVARRDTVCKGGATPVWAFRVVVEHPVTNPDGRIDGWLVLDAVSGRIVCAGLPMLD